MTVLNEDNPRAIPVKFGVLLGNVFFLSKNELFQIYLKF